MKYFAVVLMLFVGSSVLFAQDLKVVGGDEISLGVQKGESEEFKVTLKNTTNKDIEITSFRCKNSEIFLYEQDDLTVEANDKIKLDFRCSPQHSGKQQFQVYVDYNSNGESKKAYFRIKVNPKY